MTFLSCWSLICQLERLTDMGVESMPFVDLLCQMLDMVSPRRSTAITFVLRVEHVSDLGRLADLKRCRQAKIFFNAFFNVRKVHLFESFHVH
jgi:serine/threonine-protein phosphatase 2A regulatory subunit B''